MSQILPATSSVQSVLSSPAPIETSELAHETRQTSRASRADAPNPPEAPAPAAQCLRPVHFAVKEQFAWWFPKISEDDSKPIPKVWTSRRSRALLLQITLVVAVLVINLVFTVSAMRQITSRAGVGIIHIGDCRTIGKLNEWLHLLINLLSTGLLSASNYCMQLQAAPTRADIDRAHAAENWLDIGVPSVRNLRHISNWRRVGWGLLALSSLPIHLVYNSAVFQSLSSYDYTVVVVKDSFLHNASWSLESAVRNQAGDPGWDDPRVDPPSVDAAQTIRNIQRDVLGIPYEEKNVSACFALYDDYFALQGNAVILVANASVQTEPANDSLLMYVSVVPRSDDWAKNLWALGNGTRAFVARSSKQPVTNWFLGPPRYQVARCLTQPPADATTSCRLEYAPWIMILVCSLNVLKAVIVVFIWAMRRWQDQEREDSEREVLYTLGDAVASFMREADPSTKKMGLATRDDFVVRRTWKKRFTKHGPKPPSEPRPWKNNPRRWLATASLPRWVFLLFACGTVLVIGVVLLVLSFRSLALRHIPLSAASLWSMGFGRLQPYTYLVFHLPRSDPAGLIANVLVANLPQLVLSLLYIFYNAMLSTFLVQREFSLFYKNRKTLRVSEPVGIQRSSFFISLPMRYGIPLYLTSGLMHWLISQSLFLARITAVHADGSVDYDSSFSTCGYSPLAIFITLVVGFILLVAIVLIGFFRKYDGTMPMASTNSRAISAACHVLPEDVDGGYLLPVKWGVVEIQDGVGKCAFTTAPSHETWLPEEGKLYH